MDEAQRHLLEKTLRRLHAGLKAFQLYPPSHPSAQMTVQDVTAGLRGYLQRHGAAALQVTKDRLVIDGVTLTEGGMNALAFFLYVRNLTSVAILPGISESEVAALLSLLSQDRQAIESSGGVERLALSQDLPHVVFKAVVLKESVDALSEAGIIEALTRMRRLSPEQREVVFSALRSGPPAAVALLASVQHASAPTSVEGDQVDVESLLIALETLDRAILDEPVEDQDVLLQSLAQGVLQLDDRVRVALAPALLSQEAEGGSGRSILSELTGREIALLMLGPVGLGDVAPRLNRFLADLRLPEDKTAGVTAFLQAALAAGSAKPGSFAAAPPGPRGEPGGAERDLWASVDPTLITFGPGDEAVLEAVRSEVSEHAVARDAIRGLINLLALQEGPEEVAETAKALITRLSFLAQDRELEMLTIVLQLLQDARARADAQRAAIDAELTRVLTAGLLDHLVHDALQARSGASDDVLHALVAVREQAMPHLVRLLEREAEATQRVQLCKLMAAVCAGRADLIGAYLPGASWDLARNLAFALGELGDPAGADHLARLAAHPEYLVRREAIDALRKIPSDRSRAALIEFLHDPDPKIQYSLLEGADTPYDARLVAWMQDVVRSPRWTHDAVALKVAAMKALARMQAGEALPLLRSLARARWALSQGRRTVREAARQIVEGWNAGGRRPS